MVNPPGEVDMSPYSDILCHLTVTLPYRKGRSYMARKLCTFLLVTIAAMTLSTSLLFAQAPSLVAKGDEVAVSPSWEFGTEIDVLPYVMNGYYASAFVARDAWRFRGVAARS